MAEFEATGVNETEVAEPSQEDTGVNEQESAETVSEEETVEEEVQEEVQDSETNAAFARMRREAEQARSEAEAAQRELAELKAKNDARAAAMSRLTGNDNGDIAAIAEATGMSEDEILAEFEAAEESAQKDLVIESLQEKITTLEADTLMQRDLAAIQKIDPTVKSLEDLGNEYGEYIIAGLSPEAAYWAIKGKEYANKATPAKPVGKVHTGPAEKDYYTDAEIDAMSSDQLSKNWKKIMASWERKK